MKFHAFFQTVLKKGEVLGTVDHFYWKKEYQARGAPHYHVLLWIKDAPVIDRDDPDQVLKWIQERITCHIPDKKSDPELHNLVTRYQMHKCSSYCKRKRKVGSVYMTRCRFRFPRPPCETAKLNSVNESLKSRNRIYELARTESEIRVNDYNPLLLMLWKANIDIQFVAESSLALAHYVSGYVTKAEKSSMQEIWNEVSENKSVYSRLWSFGVRSLRSRECGLYEASDLLLGDHLTEKSDTVKWIDVSMPHKRKRRLKDHNQLEQLARRDPDADDIYEDSLLETHYPQRPDRLEDVCLYDFVAKYDWQTKDKNGERKYSLLNKPRLPNHRLYDPQKENERGDYFYSLILLFVPFRDESSLLLDNETAEAAFNRLMTVDSSAYHDKLQKMLEAQSRIKDINEARQADGEEQRLSTDDNDPQLMGEAKNAMHDLVDMMGTHSSDQLSLEEREAMLNADQRRIYDTVREHCLHQKRHEDGQCNCDFQPLTMFVSGVGGTGKSFLIEAVKSMVGRVWTEDNVNVVVAAPTGLAAFNVGGLTIHRLFQLPIEHEGKTAEYWSLSKDTQKVMKTKLRHVKLIIVDEISMVSSLNLAYMHLRLEELFGGDQWFGCKNMMFVGDILQLQPVSGNPVFEKITKKSILNQLGCVTSVNIWRDSVVYDELTINERQKSDAGFAKLLDTVRRGSPTDETVSTLQTRVIHGSASDKFNELCSAGQTPVCLFPTRKACQEFNVEMLQALASKVHELSCTDQIDQTSSTRKWTKKAADQLEKLNSDCNMTAGLEAKLLLAVGARVMLRRNIDTKKGLVNGAIGTVLSITKERVSVKFDHITEPYKVERVQSRFMVMKNFYVYREQFPLILAYAVTIHKCQGLSLDCAIVDLSDKVFSAGMAYVALSRVRSLAGLHLSAFDPVSIIVSTSCLKEVNRLRETFRSDLPLYDIPVKPTTRRNTRKRKLTGKNDCGNPPKKIKQEKSVTKCDPAPSATGTKRKQSEPAPDQNTKRPQTDNGGSDCVVTGFQPGQVDGTWPELRYHQVNEQWQRVMCPILGLRFVRPNRLGDGGPDVILTRPRGVKRIVADGNCLFRCLSYALTGSESQYHSIRTKICDHLISIAHFMLPHITGRYNQQYTSIQQYLQDTRMDINYVWGTDVEIMTFAHIANTKVLVYTASTDTWLMYKPGDVDRSLDNDVTARSVYIRLTTWEHFEVVKSIH